MSRRLTPRLAGLAALATAALAAAASAVAIVPPGAQAVILGQHGSARVAAAPGLVLHWPLAEQVVRLDRRMVGFAAGPVAFTAADGQPLLVDLAGQYRIVDPLRASRAFAQAGMIEAELARLAAAQAPARLAGQALADLARPGSTAPLAAALDAALRRRGVAVADLRLRRVTLAPPARQAVFARMADEGEAAILSAGDSGVQQAMQIRSDAEVAAARIIGASAGRDPEFYDFYRAMNSYETVFADPARRDKAALIVPADSAYLRQMYPNGAPR